EPSEPSTLPNRQRRQRAPESDGDGRPASRPAAGPPPPTLPPAEPAPYRPEPVHAADEQAPLSRAERTLRREAQPPTHHQVETPAPSASAAEASPAPAAAPDPAARLTQAGLPRRVPRANMAPGMAAGEQAGGAPAAGPTSGRSPDEVRSMLSSYRTGIERGRTVAGGSDPGERPPDAP
ncbi:MAG TPA: hypothetical protein VEY96_01770, partial [Actinomycetes bacterium]|nr:hypothetical protein [Actinomycetes bacterium]